MNSSRDIDPHAYDVLHPAPSSSVTIDFATARSASSSSARVVAYVGSSRVVALLATSAQLPCWMPVGEP
jgi:hypothetical protein